MNIPNYYEFFSQPKIISGNKALDHIPVELGSLGATTPLVITDREATRAGLGKQLINAFKDSNNVIGALFDDSPPQAGIKLAEELAGLYRAKRCDVIIAVGGGSVMDLAKGANIVVSENYESLLNFEKPDSLKKRLGGLIAVPTARASARDMRCEALLDKKRFQSEFLYPDLVVLDPRMTCAKDADVVRESALIALAGAVEVFAMPEGNPMTEAYARSAVQFIYENLTEALKRPGNKKRALALANAGVLSGIACSNAGTGVTHALAAALADVYGFAPGLLAGILLPHVLKYKQGKGQVRSALLEALTGYEEHAMTPEEQRPVQAFSRIDELLASVPGLPRSLKELHLQQYRLEEAAKGAVALCSEKIDAGICLAILEQAWG